MARALVLDGHLKSSLAAVRVLGDKQVYVVAGAERKSAMALHSRYSKKSFVYTSPKDNQKLFLEEIKTFVSDHFRTSGEKLVVYCFSDATHLSIARKYNDLKEWLVMPSPDPVKMEVAFDKFKTYELARKLNVPTIKTFSIDDRHTVDYPAVVKNAHSIVWNDGEEVSGTAEFVFTPKELNVHYEALSSTAGEAPLIQEFIKGDEYGVEFLVDDGEVLLEFAHKRIRSLSPTGGAAVVKETAPDTSEVALMRRYARILMEELSWSGPAMIEFKIDDRDGSVKLMEINGRFWGSLPLPQGAGVDFVGGYFDMLTGVTVEQPSVAPPSHHRTYHLLGDLKCLLTVLFKRDKLRPVLYPSRMKALLDFALEGVRGKSDVFRINDPAPSFWEIIDILKK